MLSSFHSFEDVVEAQFGESGSEFPDVLHESMMTIHRYQGRFNGITASVRKHARYILNALVSIGEDQDFTDFSTFVGLLSWLYFKLDPGETDRYAIFP